MEFHFVRLDKKLTLQASILTPNLSPPCYPQIMKTYLFNVDNGLYEGESFEEADMLQYEDGITLLPPPDYGHGQVPVFDRRTNDWSVIPVAIARQLLNLRNDEVTEQQS